MASSSLIPNEIMDAPTQRVYLTTISILIQSYKLQQFFTSSSSDSHRLLLQWSIIDVILVIVVRRIKVPRLTPNRFATVLIISMLCAIDWILFGAWKVRAALSLYWHTLRAADEAEWTERREIEMISIGFDVERSERKRHD